MADKVYPVKFASSFRKDEVVVQPLKVNDGGKGKSAYVNMKKNNLFEGEECRVTFAPKPGMNETKVTPYTKIKLTLQLNPEDEKHAAFTDKLRELDDAILEHFFAKRQQVWPDKAKYMSDKNSLMAMYNPLIKEGRTLSDGRTYKPSFTLQVPNLSELIEKLVIETKEKPDGSKDEQVTDVLWKTVVCKAGVEPNPKQPKFYLFMGKDEKGVDQIVSRVPMRRKDGSVQTDENGLPIRRWVGPQDIKAGCVVRPVFEVSKCYVVANFGCHLTLKALIIKPAPPKESAEFEGVQVVDDTDPLLAARVLSSLESNTEVPPDAPPAEEEAVHADIEAPELPVAEDTEIKSPSKKRKPEEEKSAPKKKKSAAAEL